MYRNDFDHDDKSGLRDLAEAIGSSAQYYENYGAIFGYGKDMFSETYKFEDSSEKSSRRHSSYDFDDDWDDDNDNDDFDDDDFDDDEDDWDGDDDWDDDYFTSQLRREAKEACADIKDKEVREDAIEMYVENLKRAREESLRKMGFFEPYSCDSSADENDSASHEEF